MNTDFSLCLDPFGFTVHLYVYVSTRAIQLPGSIYWHGRCWSVRRLLVTMLRLPPSMSQPPTTAEVLELSVSVVQQQQTQQAQQQTQQARSCARLSSAEDSPTSPRVDSFRSSRKVRDSSAAAAALLNAPEFCPRTDRQTLFLILSRQSMCWCFMHMRGKPICKLTVKNVDSSWSSLHLIGSQTGAGAR